MDDSQVTSFTDDNKPAATKTTPITPTNLTRSTSRGNIEHDVARTILTAATAAVWVCVLVLKWGQLADGIFLLSNDNTSC